MPMVILNITAALSSLLKGSGAFFALYCANEVFKIAIDRGGVYVFLHALAIYLVLLSVYCIIDCATEFYEIVQQAFPDEDDTGMEE